MQNLYSKGIIVAAQDTQLLFCVRKIIAIAVILFAVFVNRWWWWRHEKAFGGANLGSNQTVGRSIDRPTVRRRQI